MILKQFLRLGGSKHAIKEASVSLFFGSPFLDWGILRELIKTEFKEQFTHFQDIQAFQVQLRGDLTQPEAVSGKSEITGPIGFQATYFEGAVATRILQLRNDTERVFLSLHNLRYERWADFMLLFERIATALATPLAE